MESKDKNMLIANPSDEVTLCKIDSNLEAANSVAFECIDEQFYAGKLTSTEVAMYKARYIKLHETLKKSREGEFNLHQLIKNCISEIECQQTGFLKFEQFPDNAITEPSQLRAQILSTHNAAMETEERVEMLKYEVGLLREERKLLKRDFSRLSTAELEVLGEDVDIFQEMDNRIKKLQNQCQEMWLEMDMIKMETKRCREQFRQANEAEEDARAEYELAIMKLSDVKAEWVLASALPGQYLKETEKARKYKSEAEKVINTLDTEYAKLQESQHSLEQQIFNVKTDNENCKTDTLNIRGQTVDKKNETEKTDKHLIEWSCLEMVKRTEKARLLQGLEMCVQDKKMQAENQTKLKWEKEATFRNLKNAILQQEIMEESVKLTKLLYDKTRARFVITPKYDGALQNRKKKYLQAVTLLNLNIEDETKRGTSEQLRVNQLVLVTERRLVVLEHLRAENFKLLRLATALTEDMTKSVCEYNAARRKFDRLSEEFNLKQKHLQDQILALEKLEVNLNEVSKVYTEVKLERNKCVSLLQMAVKVAQDTKARLRLHSNEAEILITCAQKKEHDILLQRALISNTIAQRDHKRHELCKMAEAQAIQNSKMEQMKQAIQRLESMYNQAEGSIISLKKACERNANLRNERAIILVERNQEVYLLQEREKSQDTAIGSGEVDLRGLEDECACSKVYLDQVKRYIHLVKQQIPQKETLEKTVHGLVRELIGIRAQKKMIVSWFDDPDKPGRLRLLGGTDPTQSELWIILGKLEKRLSSKEEDLSEKNLVYEAVCRLVDALRVRTELGKNDTLVLALQVNNIQAKLLKLSRNMETIFAELTMSRAEKDSLHNRIQVLETGLDVYTMRSINGIPPSREILKQFEEMQEFQRIRNMHKQTKTCIQKITQKFPPSNQDKNTKPNNLPPIYRPI